MASLCNRKGEKVENDWIPWKEVGSVQQVRLVPRTSLSPDKYCAFVRIWSMRRLFLVLSCLCIIACRTPEAVKRLSAEQVKTQATYEQSLKAYFSIIEQLAANQIAASSQAIDDATNSIIDVRKNQALKALDTADATGRRAIVEQLAQQTKAELETAANSKAQIGNLVSKLRAKHKEMLDAYTAIRSAQEKLDTYIQLRKADEIAVDELTAIVGVNREKVEKGADDIAVLVQKLSNFTKP